MLRGFPSRQKNIRLIDDINQLINKGRAEVVDFCLTFPANKSKHQAQQYIEGMKKCLALNLVLPNSGWSIHLNSGSDKEWFKTTLDFLFEQANLTINSVEFNSMPLKERA